MFLFLFVHLPVFLYLGFRLILPLKTSRTVKILAALILLLITQHFALRRLLNYLSTPELPGPVILLEGWTSATAIFLFLLLLLSDAILLVRGILKKKKNKAGSGSSSGGRTSSGSVFLPGSGFSPGRRKALLAVTAAASAAWGVSRSVAAPEVISSQVSLPRLPPALDGLSLVQLTDLHASPLFDKSWMQALVRRVNALEPDFIVLTGDMADGVLERRISDLSPLAALRARYGIYGCVGNHEYYIGFDAMVRILESMGVVMLLNSHALASARGETVCFAGVTDVAAERFGLPLPDAAAALAGAPENALKILLKHRPGNAGAGARAGADLQLSGHTHGGHALGLDRVVARFNNGYVRGLYHVEGMPLYVSAGAGLWNGFPLRMGVPPEISRIVLRAPSQRI